jgi:hypothetical protein
MTGRAYIRLLKDKPGGIKAYGGKWSQGEGQAFAAFTIKSERVKTRSGERIDTTFAVTSDGIDRGEFRPTVYMEKVSEFLYRPTTQLPASKSAIETGAGGKAEHVRKAIDVLVAEKFVEMDTAKKFPTFKPLKPYLIKDDPLGNVNANPNDYLSTATDVADRTYGSQL